MTRWVHAKGFAEDVRLLTAADLDPVALHNTKLFAAVREADREVDAAARAVARAMVGARSLREFAVATGLVGRGYRALVRLLRDDMLRLLRAEAITPAAMPVL